MDRKTKELFESIYRSYNGIEYIQSDPLRYVYRYTSPEDREIVALLSSLFAYGRVTSIFSFLDSLFLFLDRDPARALAERRYPRNRLYYRFQSDQDVTQLLDLLSDWIRQTPYPRFERKTSTDIYQSIDTLIHELNESISPGMRSKGWTFLIGKPGTDSAAKRWCLFHRWMVRRESPDTGLYRTIQPRQLIFPLDTHIVRLAGWAGLTSRRSVNRTTAREITDSFRHLSDDDPLRYDFPLTRPGILSDGPMLQKLQRLRKT